jgi:hypothetical protein
VSLNRFLYFHTTNGTDINACSLRIDDVKRRYHAYDVGVRTALKATQDRHIIVMSTGRSPRRRRHPSQKYFLPATSGSDIGEIIEKRPAYVPTPKSPTRLKLRLDLNLDVDIQIKARVHGDVTLSLK